MPSETEPILNTCPECDQVIDVTGVEPYSKIVCPHCGETIRVRTRFEHFTIREEIGEGGMSRVFRAEDSTLGREVALKILHPHIGEQPELTAQFEREARVTASISHPNVVQVYSVGNDQGYFFIAMELLETQSLDDQISTGRIAEPAALRVIHEVAQGLAAAYQYGLIHRDIKPGNILLDRDGTARLVDFGLALIQGSEEDLGEMWATPYYVPPEKLEGQPDDFRGDIFSLGATLFHALAGQPPHAANTASVEELIEIKAQPANLKAVAPKLKGPTIQLVQRMMAHRPDDRFASYQDLLQGISGTRKAVDPDFIIPNKATGMPLWAKLVGGLVALAFAGGLAALVWPRNNFKEIDIGAAGGSGEVVMSAGEAALIRQLDTARAAYRAGNRAEAVRLFQMISERDSARADLRAWAEVHLGLEALLKGEPEKADRHFAAGAAHAGGDLPGLKDGMSRLTGLVAPEAPPTGPIAEQAALEDLVFGLKSWHAGHYAGAEKKLGRFTGATLAEAFAWLRPYQPLCQPFQADAGLLAAAPPLPGTEDPAQLQAALEDWQAATKQLQFEPGRKLLQERMTQAGTRIEALRMADQTAARQRDEEKLRAAEESSARLAPARKFAEAGAIWTNVETETDWGRKQARSAAEAWNLAGRFHQTFLENLGSYRYQGEILRNEGRAFTARIVGAKDDTLIVDLGFGPTKLKMDSISAEGILRIAQRTILEDASPETREGAAFFAWFIGRRDAAEDLSAGLQSRAGFTRRWESITLPLEFR